MRGGVSAPYRRRASRSEPWRYRCPDCGSVSVRRLTGKNRDASKDYPHGTAGEMAAISSRALRFRCHRCQERKPVLVDMRKGKEVTSI